SGGAGGGGRVDEGVSGWARRVGWNAQLNMPGRDERVGMGFVACGPAYAVLRHALGELNLLGRLPLLKLGVTLPVDAEAVRRMGARCERLVVLEWGAGGVEERVRELVVEGAAEGDEGGVATRVYGKRLPGGELGLGPGAGWGVSALMERLVPMVRRYGGLPVHVTSVGLSDRLTAMESAAGIGSGVGVVVPGRDVMGCPVEEETSTGVVVERLRRALADAEWMRSKHRRKPMGLRVVGLEEVSGGGEAGGAGGGGGGEQGESGGERGGRRGRDAVVRWLSVDRLEALRPVLRQLVLEGGDGVFLVEVPWEGRSGRVRRRALRRLRGRVMRMGEGAGEGEGGAGVRVEVIDPEERGRYRRLLERAVLGDGVTVVLVCPRRKSGTGEEVGKVGGEGLFVARGVRTRELLAAGRISTAGLGVSGGRGLVARGSVVGGRGMGGVLPGSVRVDVTGPTLGRAGGLGECSAWVDVVRLPTGLGLSGRGRVAGWTEGLPAASAPVHGRSGVWWCHWAAGSGEGSDLMCATLAEAGRRMGYRVLYREVGGGLADRGEEAWSRWSGGGLRWSDREGGGGRERLGAGLGERGHGQVVFTRDEEGGDAAEPGGGGWGGVSCRMTPVIPRGRADLVLGASVGALSWAVSGEQGMGVASPGVSRWVVETDETVEAWRRAGQGFDAGAVLGALRGVWERGEGAGRGVGLGAGREAERRLGTRAGWGLVLLGYAWQRGWVPLTESALQEGVDAVWGSVGQGERRWVGLGVARGSVDLGRRLAVEGVGVGEDVGGGVGRRVVDAGWQPVAEAWVDRLGRSVGQPFWLGPAARERLGRRYGGQRGGWGERAAEIGLSDGLMRVVAEQAGRCVRWGGGRSGLRLARRYGEAVLGFAEAELRAGGDPRMESVGFGVGGMAVDRSLSELAAEGLAAVMLVEDLVWTAGLAADRERWRGEWEALGVSKEVAALARLRHELWIDVEAYGLNVSTRVPVWPWVARRLATRRGLRVLERTLGRMGPVDRGALSGYERLMAMYVEGVVDRGDERWRRWLGVPGRRMPRGLAGRRLRARLIERAVRAVEEAAGVGVGGGGAS
ncbi:MAG: hypothetical protein AAF750_15460, partial [Planctomycetota bacterium]